jgi:hypothetical protein
LEEIEGVQDRLRTLAKEYKNDFTEPNALDAVIDKDLQAAVGSLGNAQRVVQIQNR